MKSTKYVTLLGLFIIGSVFQFVPPSGLFITYVQNVTFAVGMGALLALLIELASGGKLLLTLQEMLSPTFIEHESGNKAKAEFRKAFEKASSLDYRVLTFALSRKNFSMEDFENKLKKGACIRILISSENSKFLAHRAKDSKVDEEVMKKDIRATIAKFKELQKQVEGKREITGSLYLRTHQEPPCRGYSRFDDRTFTTPYFTDSNAATGPLLEITRATSFLSIGYSKQFEAFWNTSDPIVNIHQFQHKEMDNKPNSANAETTSG